MLALKAGRSLTGGRQSDALRRLGPAQRIDLAIEDCINSAVYLTKQKPIPIFPKIPVVPVVEDLPEVIILSDCKMLLRG